MTIAKQNMQQQVTFAARQNTISEVLEEAENPIMPQMAEH